MQNCEVKGHMYPGEKLFLWKSLYLATPSLSLELFCQFILKLDGITVKQIFTLIICSLEQSDLTFVEVYFAVEIVTNTKGAYPFS